MCGVGCQIAEAGGGGGAGGSAGAGAAPLPAAAVVLLPAVSVRARVLEQTARGAPPPPGAVLRAGSYLAATADIGLFEHTLSTDLLNHLVFVQKVFMKVSAPNEPAL